jgi:cytochrome c
MENSGVEIPDGSRRLNLLGLSPSKQHGRKTMKILERRFLLTALLVTVWLSAATAVVAEPLDGETLFNQRTCFTCHGKDAKTPILPSYPLIAGQNPEYALQQMRDIKSGARTNGNTAAMRGVMGLVNDDEMKILAEYIAQLER